MKLDKWLLLILILLTTSSLNYPAALTADPPHVYDPRVGLFDENYWLTIH